MRRNIQTARAPSIRMNSPPPKFGIAPSEKDAATETLEKRLWDAADHLRANSGLASQQYSQPVPGLDGDIRHGGKVKSECGKAAGNSDANGRSV